MTPERWRRIEQLFHDARARSLADLAAFLRNACADDEAMRRNVESLLDESASDDGFLAALHHPNICAIYGFEEADGSRGGKGDARQPKQ